MLTTYSFLAINIVIYISANKFYVMLCYVYPDEHGLSTILL